MPISSFVIPFFIMFGSGAVGVGREFVLLGGSAMCVVCFMHDVFSYGGTFPYENL